MSLSLNTTLGRIYLFRWACAVAIAFGSSSEIIAQNSSLFQRPVQYVAQNSPDSSAAAASGAMSGRGIPDPAMNTIGPNSQVAGQVPYGVSGGYPGGPVEAAPMMGLQTAWSYVPPTPARALKIHDIVQIRIEESATSLAQGNTSSRKTTSYDAVLKDWIRLVGIDTIKPAPQSDGEPRVQTTQNEVYRGDSTQRTSESLTTNIAAEIVDIKPNGLLVLSAHKTITLNDNTWELSLTGSCRNTDIDPSNVVLSRNLLNPIINKQDRGHVRDGYSRGWLTKLLARIKPF